VLHVYKKLRPGQTRGVPYLTPVIETLKMLGRYTEAELMAAVIAGMFTVFVESERGGLDLNDASGIGAETGAQSSDKDVKLGAGAIVDLNPGERSISPTPAAEPGVRRLRHWRCAASSASRSSCRTRCCQALHGELQRFAGGAPRGVEVLPRARAWLATMVDAGVRGLDGRGGRERPDAAPGYFDDPLMRRAYLACEWVGDGPISVDPVKDIEAAKGRVDLGISTLQKESSLHDGGDWKKNHEQRAREVAARVKDKLELDPSAAPAGDPNGARTSKPADSSTTNNDGGSDLEKDDTTKAALASRRRPWKAQIA
jgi:hypothetical protein